MAKDFKKYTARQLKKLGMEKEIIVDCYNKRVVVKVCSVIPPRTDFGTMYRLNVKVIKSEYNMPVYNEEGRYKRDERGYPIREWKDRVIQRCHVNSINGTIRREVLRHMGKYMEIFGYNYWNMKVEKVTHLR